MGKLLCLRSHFLSRRRSVLRKPLSSVFRCVQIAPSGFSSSLRGVARATFFLSGHFKKCAGNKQDCRKKSFYKVLAPSLSSALLSLFSGALSSGAGIEFALSLLSSLELLRSFSLSRVACTWSAAGTLDICRCLSSSCSLSCCCRCVLISVIFSSLAGGAARATAAHSSCLSRIFLYRS